MDDVIAKCLFSMNEDAQKSYSVNGENFDNVDEEIENLKIENNRKSNEVSKVFLLELDYLKEQYRELDEALKKGKTRIEQTQYNNIQLQKEKDKLLNTIDELRKQIQLFHEQDNERRDSVLDEINLKNDLLENRIKEMEKIIKDLKNQNNDLKCDLDIANGFIEELQNERQNLQQKLKECQENELRKEEEINKLKDISVKNELEKMLLEEKLGRCQEEDKKMKLNLTKLKKELNGIEVIRDRLEAELASQHLSTIRYERQIEQLETELNDSITKKNEMQKLLEVNNSIIAETNEKLFKLSEVMKTLHYNRTTIEQKLTDQLEDIEKLCDENEEIKLNNDDLKIEISELQVKFKDIDKINKAKSAEILNLKSELNQLKTKQMDLEFERDKLKKSNAEYQNTIDELSKELMMIRKKSLDTPLYEILLKIIETGWNHLTLQELTQLHEMVMKVSEKLLEENTQVIQVQQVTENKYYSNITYLSSQKKSILQEIFIIQNSIATGHIEANKRQSALTKTMQQYQRELTNIREWVQQFEEQIIDRPKSKLLEQQKQRLRENAQLNENHLMNFLQQAKECKKQTIRLERSLKDALQNIKNLEAKVLQDETVVI